MKKVLITLLAFICLSTMVFAINNADPDPDLAEKLALKALLKTTPVIPVKSSGIPLAAGDYYIPKGSNALGFDSLHTAVDSINANGVTGTVNLILDADTLREPSFTFDADLSVTNNVVVKPAFGKDVVLIVAGGPTHGNGDQLIGFNRGFVTFDGSSSGSDLTRNLTITTEQTSIEVPIGLNTANADTVVLKNLIIKNLDNGVTKFKYGIVTNDVAGIQGFTVQNCQIGSPEFPVWRDGVAVWGSSSGPTQGIVMLNDIYAGCRGISTYVVNDCNFSQNNIYMMPTTSSTTYAYVHGIYLTGASGPTTIHNNVVNCLEAASVSGTYVVGIAFAGNSEGAGEIISVANNMVSVGAVDETFNVYGIGLRSANPMGNIDAYHNTIVVNDHSSTLTSYAVGNHTNGTGSVDMELKNNIIINKHMGSTASAAIGLIPTTTVLSSDYNLLQSAQKFVNFKGTSYTDLAAWQATSQDVNSVSKDVTFDGLDDLHLAGSSIGDFDLAGTPLSVIGLDIDNEARDATYPYMGADEGTTVLTPPPPKVFFSEYIEGSSNNKALEIYNGSGADVDLSQFTVKLGANGGAWGSSLTMSGTLTAGEVYVIANASAVAGILDVSDATSTVTYFNGDDAVGLFYGEVLIDVFGTYLTDPGSSWDVAGITGATVDHTLIRKTAVTQGNTDWALSAGTNLGDSEWIVLAKDTFTYLGEHPSTIPLTLETAYSASGTAIVVDYNLEVTSVDPANYSIKGTSGVTFATAEIDPMDVSKVILTASAEIMYDFLLDTLIDAANVDTAIFYAGITPIGYTSTTNVGGHILNGYTALFNGYVTANDAYNNVWVNDAEGGEHTGVMIYSSTFDAEVAVGDHISFIATRAEYNNLTELTNPVLISLMSSGNDPYGPFDIAGADIDTALAADTDPGEKWEGQLVRITGAVVESYSSTNYEYTCTDDGGVTSFRVGDNVDYQLANVSMSVGDSCIIVGVVDYTSGEYRINPRGADDIKKLIPEGAYDIDEDFTTADDVANWRSDNSGWTTRTHVNGTLQLGDAGWTFDARRTVVAEPNTFFKATATVKTKGSFSANPTTQYLKFGIDGLGDEKYEVSCVSDDVFTTFTIIGYAVGDTGSLYIAGQGGSGADTAWVDAYTYLNNYAPEVTEISEISVARTVADGDYVATKGVVTATKNFGSSGPAYIQDGLAGVAVYDYDVAQNVEFGDEILVVGVIDIYNGLVEITNADYIILSKGNEVLPTIIDAAAMDGEAFEGMLVTIEKCDTLDSGLLWATTLGMNTGFNLKDSYDSTFYCFIDKDTDIDGTPKPMDWPYDITGIVGDYNGAQLLPRSLADFAPSNRQPGAFSMLHPTDGTVITSLDDPNIMKVLMGVDSTLVLFMNWSKSIDPDEGDIVTYQVMISPNGPEEDIITQDTMTYIPIDMKRPWSMNGTYTAYVVATDLLGKTVNSDTVQMTFDFPAPPEITYADIILVDGAPKLYATFNMNIEKAVVENFMIVDKFMATSTAPTSVDSLAPNIVMISGDLPEDHCIALAYSGIVAPEGTITTSDTAWAGEVLIPFSANHPEDALHMITNFESDLGLFLAPNWSGSTTAGTSTFAISDEEAFEGSKSGKMSIVDNAATTGGWYVRDVYGYPFSYKVKSTSKLMFAVKGTDANVDIRLSIKDSGTGYEQSPWVHVSVIEEDWQIVSFDLLNDQSAGWAGGNGIIEGETVLVEGIHIRCTEDKDVTLYIDGFTERQTDIVPVDVTFEVNMAVQSLLGKFNIGSDFVDVAGTFNGWGSNSMVLDDSDGDSVYSYTLTGLLPGMKLEYKFRINGSWDDNTAEFPYGGPARTFTVPDTNVVVSYWYNNQDRSVLGIDDLAMLPKVFALHQNYPNPFNPITTIKYDLPKDSHVKIMIFDLMGREVRTLINTNQKAGYQTIQWNASDNYGKRVASGYYIYVMQAGDFHKTEKMILLK